MSKQWNTKNLSYAALLTALSIILTRFLSVMLPIPGLPNALRVGFGAIPTVIAGLFFGPVIGGFVGGAADLIGVMINPMGPVIHPGFTLTAILTGVIPGLVMNILNRSRQDARDKMKTLTLAVVLSLAGRMVLCEMLLNTYFLTSMMNTPFAVLFWPRAIKSILIFVIHTVVVLGLVKIITRARVIKMRAA